MSKREISFRGIRIDNGEWVYGDLINEGIDAHSKRIEVGIKELMYYPVEVNPETVGQFTGLLDKNGVKIFEGDVVKAWNRKLDREFTGDIRMPKSSWCVCSTVDNKHYFFRTSQYSMFEITGNIHQP